MGTISQATATAIKATCPGATGKGPLSVQGVQVGDVLVQVEPYGFPPGQGFETVVSVADELQQLQPLDWSSVNFTFYLLRGA